MGNNSLKILFFGVFSENSTNISQANAFEKNGCIVTRHDFRANPNLPEDRGYDFIFYSKCNELGIDAVKKYKGIKCLWYMDPMNGNYNDSFISKLRKVDFACFALYEPFLESAIQIDNDKKLHLIEEGFDPDVDVWHHQQKLNYKISFIGNLYNESRREYYQKVNFDLIHCLRLEHPFKVAQSEINLNFCDGGTSDRAYKIMSSGGFLLTEDWPGCTFKDLEDIVIFYNPEDLKGKAEYYLNNTEEWIRIALNGYKAVQKYSRTNWAKRILDIYKQCK